MRHPMRFASPMFKRLMLSLVPAGARDALWKWKRKRQALAAIRKPPGPARPHGLPGPLIVSLTSYPPRFPALHRTIASLLRQELRPDAVLLWIARDDFAHLPPAVRALEREGLRIEACDDLRSYKKIVPALERFPEAYVAIADDDVYYPPDWLSQLVDAVGSDPPVIAYHRGHRLRFDANGALLPYGAWLFDVEPDAGEPAGADIMPTGLGGVLYPPGALHPDVTRADLFTKLAPWGDDLWLYWMARRRGALYRKAGGWFHPIHWPGTQDHALYTENAAGRNDIQIRALIEAFGPPLP